MKAKKKKEGYIKALMKNPLELIIVGIVLVLVLSTALFAVSAKVARVHLVNAVTDSPPGDLSVNNQMVFSGVAYGDMTDYTKMAGGKYYLQFLETGTNGPVLANFNLMFSANFDYTVILTGNVGNITYIFLGKDRINPEGKTALLRIANADQFGGPVDFAIANGSVLFSNIEYMNSVDFITVDAGRYSFEIREAGTTNVLKKIPRARLQRGDAYTAVVLGSGDGSSVDLALYKETSNNWQKWRFED